MSLPPHVRSLILSLYEQGYSVKEISKSLNLSYHKVYHVVSYRPKKQSQKPVVIQMYEKIKSLGLDRKLKHLLLQKVEEKKRVYRIPYKRVLELFEQDPEVQAYGINFAKLGKTKRYEFINYFIKAEFGSVENYLKLIDPKYTSHKPTPKGVIEREAGTIEVDGTDITLGFKQYSVLLAIDQYSGFILGFKAIEKREKGATTDKNAFSSLDFGEFLFEIFDTYGVPEKLVVDNAKNLTSKYIEKVCAKLSVELHKAQPYKAWQKTIERTIKEIKKEKRFSYQGEDINDFLRQVINYLNLSERHFKHFDEPVIPQEIFEKTHPSHYREVDTDTLREAFLIEEEVSLRDSTIRWQGKTYSIPTSYRGKVIIKVDPFNNTKAQVYTPEGTFLGYAHKVSKSLSDIETQERALRNKERRLKKKERELISQVEEIKKELESLEYQDERKEEESYTPQIRLKTPDLFELDLEKL